MYKLFDGVCCTMEELIEALKYDGQTHSTATACQHGGNPVEGYEAGDDCAQGAVEAWIPI